MTKKIDLFNKVYINPADVQTSDKWFKEQVARMKTARVTSKRVMMQHHMEMTFTLKPGQMYMFYYDPKYKDTLPYYDEFPLIFPFRKDKEHFWGLNFHYLPYNLRMLLFKKLVAIDLSKIHNDIKIKQTWATISALATSNLAKHCVKQYLFTHIASPFNRVLPIDWPTALCMPVAQFVGAKQEQVWARLGK
jgi:hypothetical protein